MEKPEDGERLIGVTQIWERLFLGSLYDAERLCRANPHAIGAVLSLSATLPCNTRREINYIHLHVEDAHAIPVDQFTAVMSAIAENIRTGKASAADIQEENEKVAARYEKTRQGVQLVQRRADYKNAVAKAYADSRIMTDGKLNHARSNAEYARLMEIVNPKFADVKD
jgi:hypothetical protein